MKRRKIVTPHTQGRKEVKKKPMEKVKMWKNSNDNNQVQINKKDQKKIAR